MISLSGIEDFGYVDERNVRIFIVFYKIYDGPCSFSERVTNPHCMSIFPCTFSKLMKLIKKRRPGVRKKLSQGNMGTGT
jgi:hypothetical protein